MISVGEDNDYGHPADSTLRLLRKWGMMVKRTSIDGDIVVSVDSGGHLRVRSSR
jgi:competence protein ComEC